MASSTVTTPRRRVSTKSTQESRASRRAGVKAFKDALARERDLRELIASLRDALVAGERAERSRAELRPMIEEEIRTREAELNSLKAKITKAAARP